MFIIFYYFVFQLHPVFTDYRSFLLSLSILYRNNPKAAAISHNHLQSAPATPVKVTLLYRTTCNQCWSTTSLNHLPKRPSISLPCPQLPNFLTFVFFSKDFLFPHATRGRLKGLFFSSNIGINIC